MAQPASFYAARRGRITASSVGGILGVSPTINADGVLRRMVRDTLGAPSEFSGNVATDYGQRKEHAAIQDFMIETGLDVVPCDFVPYNEWLGVTPDGLIGDDTVLEIKCPFKFRAKYPPEFASIMDQPHYYAQVQIQMFCTSRPRAKFYQWAPGGTMLEDVDYDSDWIAGTIPVLIEFYDRYLAALKSPEDHLAPHRCNIDTIYAQKLLTEYDELREGIDNAETRMDDIVMSLVIAAGERDALICGRKLSLVERAGSISYAKALAKYAPDADLEPFRGAPSSSWKLSARTAKK